MKFGYVSILGLPNSGKSTLLNRIVETELSIITPKPQTTRHKIAGIYNSKDAQIVFWDTPGLHKSTKEINKYMLDTLKDAVRDSDLVCYLLDIDREVAGVADLDSQLKTLKEWVADVKDINGKEVAVINKVDLVIDRPWTSLIEDCKKRCGMERICAISAKTGFGVAEFIEVVKEMTPEGLPLYPDDTYTDKTLRFLAAEIIREQATLLLHEELPYSLAVEIEDYKEKEGVHVIKAAVIIEKESQKPIVIGKDGRMIKRIGELAREKMERLFGVKIYLELFVKVEKNWTKDERKVRSILG